MTIEQGAPAPEQAPAQTEETPPPATGDDLAGELAKWKNLAKKNEERAKANAAAAKELETFRQQTMSETERAIEAARTEARAEVTRQFGGRLVTAEVRAAAAGRAVDVDALLEAVDPAKFVSEDGEPDREAIAAWINRVAPAAAPTDTPSTLPFPDLGQGARGEHLALNSDPLTADLKKHLGIA